MRVLVVVRERELGGGITGKVIGAALEVHRGLGAGLLESAYARCLVYELRLRGIAFRTEVPVPVVSKELTLDSGDRLDLLVEEKLVVELKAVETLEDVHTAQLLTTSAAPANPSAS